MHVLLLSGSTRSGATTTAVLRTAAALAPSGVTTAFAPSPADLPAFDPDLDRDPLPPAVAGLRRAAGAADAVLCCAPEYAGTLPGSFTNVLDWLVGGGELLGKRAAWINAASVAAPTGGAGATAALATGVGERGAAGVPAAGRRLPVPRQAVGPDGLVTDPSLRDRIAAAIPALVAGGAARHGRGGAGRRGRTRRPARPAAAAAGLLRLLRGRAVRRAAGAALPRPDRRPRPRGAPVPGPARRRSGRLRDLLLDLGDDRRGPGRGHERPVRRRGGAGCGRGPCPPAACRDAARDHGAARLVWQTAPDNHRAQRLYDRTGAARSTWLTYELPVDGAGQAAVAR